MTEGVLSFVTRLKRCAAQRCLDSGKKVHKEAIGCGADSNIFVASALVKMYSKCRSMVEAQRVFDRASAGRDVVLWTALILGYAENDEGNLALSFFSQMDCLPNSRTFVAAIKACVSLRNEALALEKGMAIHAQAAKLFSELDVFLASTLVDFYVKCGSLIDSERVFEGMKARNVVSWAALVLGYVENGKAQMGLDLLARMEEEGCLPDSGCFVAALKACACLTANEDGEKIDGKIVKHRCLEVTMAVHSRAGVLCCDSHRFVKNSLVDSYGKCGSLVDARRVFDGIESGYRDVVLCTSLLLAYDQSGEQEQALEFFWSLREEGCSPDCKTYASALKSCGSLAAVEAGKIIHAEVYRCGNAAEAQRVFDSAASVWRCLVAWTALMAGYNRQGDAKQVLSLLSEMQDEGVMPNGVSFVCVLTACSHAGLVKRGMECFEAMESEFGIVPGAEHYRCMVDLLGRADGLAEAADLARRMRGEIKGKLSAWKVVLSACSKLGNVELGKLAFEEVIKADPGDAAAHSLMTNLYRSSSS